MEMMKVFSDSFVRRFQEGERGRFIKTENGDQFLKRFSYFFSTGASLKAPIQANLNDFYGSRNNKLVLVVAFITS
jgi:hypothetical protein